jgi:hypothetical protein
VGFPGEASPRNHRDILRRPRERGLYKIDHFNEKQTDPEATVRPAGWLQKSSLCSLWPLIDCCQFYILQFDWLASSLRMSVNNAYNMAASKR